MTGENEKAQTSEVASPASTEEKPKETSAIVQSIITNLENTYNAQKSQEIQNLYNGIITAISAQGKPHIANILTALKLVEHDIIDQKLSQIRAEQAAGPAGK